MRMERKPVMFLLGRRVPVFALVLVFLLPPSVRGGEVTGGMAEVNGTKLYYETMGQGHPLLFIHGGLLHSRVWDGQFEVFAEHHRVIRYDAPGYGKSEGHDQFYSEAEDVASLLHFLQVEKTFVIGASMGGGTGSTLRSNIPTWLRHWYWLGRRSMVGNILQHLWTASANFFQSVEKALKKLRTCGSWIPISFRLRGTLQLAKSSASWLSKDFKSLLLLLSLRNR